MRYGVCTSMTEPARVRICAEAGCDYVETNFGQLSRGSDEDFTTFEAALKENGIRCESTNCFMPGDLPMVGENVDYDAIAAYVERGMERGSRIGLKTVVFGSGGARSIPENWSYKTGIAQLAFFLGDVVSPIAEKYGITVVIEPLRAAESNVVNTVREGVMLASFAGKDNISGLADLFHMICGGDTHEDLRRLKGCIAHAHISNPYGDGVDNRVFPKDASEYDYAGFISALEYCGCERCSIEAATRDFDNDTPAAIRFLKSI